MSFLYDSITKFVKLFIYVCIICIIIVLIPFINLHEKLLNQSIGKINHTVLVYQQPCTVIVHEPLGRLGNILFEFATAYGLSLDHSCKLYIGPKFFKELSQYFEVNIPNILTESQLNRTSPIQKMYNHCTYFGKLFQANISKNIELVGYWQVYKYFINHADQLRNQLRFKQSILNQIKYFIKTNVSSTISILVGIHIRRGDFVGARKISSDKFIFNAMNYFIKKYGSIKFIFVSDDKLYCRNTFSKRNDTYFTPNSFTPAMDMALLTLCNHLIITVGTYGWWGAFLLQNRTGEVLTDAKPNHSPVDVDCEASDFFPPWFSFLNMTK